MSNLSPGFADPVTDAQICFRAVLDAMSRPGQLRTVPTLDAPAPLGVAAAAVLLTLVDQETPVWLDDPMAPARDWIEFHCGAPVTADPRRAMFGVADTLPDLAAFEAGSHEQPEAAATLILRVAKLGHGQDGDGSVETVSSQTCSVATGSLQISSAETGSAETNPTQTGSTGTIPTVTNPTETSRPGNNTANDRIWRLAGPGIETTTTLRVAGLPGDFPRRWEANRALFPRGVDLILCAGNSVAALPRGITIEEL